MLMHLYRMLICPCFGLLLLTRNPWPQKFVKKKVASYFCVCCLQFYTNCIYLRALSVAGLSTKKVFLLSDNYTACHILPTARLICTNFNSELDLILSYIRKTLYVKLVTFTGKIITKY